MILIILLSLSVGGFTEAATSKNSKQAQHVKHAQAKNTPVVAPAQSPTPTASAPAVEGQLLWDAWYTITLNGNVKYGYYNDRLEKKQGRLHFQNKIWKKEEGFINEEQLGAFAQDDAEINPLFFNFHSTYRNTETKVDATIQATTQTTTQNGRTLVIRAIRAGNELPLIRRNLPKKTFFSAFFPVWIAKQLPGLKVGQRASFYALFEDALDRNFPIESGWIRLEKPNQISVNSRDTLTTWHLDSNGVPVRIEMPGMNMVVERVKPEIAQKFLNE